MKLVAIALFLFASLCYAQDSRAQESADFQPASTNVWGAEYPRLTAWEECSSA